MLSKIEELAERAKKIAAESGVLKDSEEWEQLKKMAGDLGEDAAVFVRKYPIQSVLGGAAVGFLLGTIFGRKR